MLDELRQALPETDFVYLADHAFCPYGTKTPAEICSRALAITEFFRSNGACAVVIACNTASAFAEQLRREISLPVFDVIRPTCRVIAERKFSDVVLLATKATVESGAYNRMLKHRGVRVESIACDEFVTLVESGAETAERKKIVKNKLKILRSRNFDAVVLGCTHFPLLRDEIAEHTNKPIVDCSKSAANDISKSLRKLTTKGKGKVKFFTTGNVISACAAMKNPEDFFHSLRGENLFFSHTYVQKVIV